MTRPWKVLLVCSVAMFMAFLDVTIVNIAFPDLRADFGDASLADTSWVLNAYNVVFAALLVPAGRLADRYGRRRVFLSGLVGFLVASAVCAVAPSVGFLVAARVFQAAAGALLVPSSLALVLPEFPAEQRGLATALWGATGGVAAATGPSLGGLLVDAAGWRWVFLVNVLIALPALPFAVRLLRESRPARDEPIPDPLGVGLLAAGIGAVSLGIVKSEDWGFAAAPTLACFAVAAGLLAVLVHRTLHHDAPVVDPALLRVRTFAVSLVGLGLFSVGFYALLLGNVLFLTQVWGWSVLQAGLALTPGPVMATLMSPVGGRLSDRFGPRVVALPGGLLFTAGCVGLLATADSRVDYVAHFLPWAVLTGTGVGLSFAAWGAASVADLPAARYATGSALLTCSRQIGAVLGVALLVAVLGRTDAPSSVAGFRDAWALDAVVALVAAVGAVALGAARRGPAARPVVVAPDGASTAR